MKITNIENDQRIIYVQEQYLKSILRYEENIPDAFHEAINR